MPDESAAPTLPHVHALLAEARLEEALAAAEQLLKDLRARGDALPLARCLLARAEAARGLGLTDEVEAACAEAMPLLTDAPETLTLRGQLRTQLAVALDQAERIAAAAPEYEQAISDLEAAPTPDTLTAAQLRNNLAMIYKGLGRFAQAESHCVSALNTLEATLGRDHEEVAALYNNLGSLYYTAGFSSEAKKMFADALSIREKLLPSGHADIAQSLTNLATARHELGEDDEAIQDFARAVGILRGNLAEKPGSYQAATDDYAALLEALGRIDEAEDVRTTARQALADHAAKN